MVSKRELCKKIEEVIPNVGVCGVDIDVEYDDTAKAWAVEMHYGHHHLQTFLESEEADSCLAGRLYIRQRMQVTQLKRNFDLAFFSEH